MADGYSAGVMSKPYKDIPLPDGGKIETWYDRPSRSWVSQRKDAAGNQVGEAQYDGHRDAVPYSRDMLQRAAAKEAE